MDKPLQSTSLSFWQCARNLLAASFNSETLRSRTAVHTNGVSTVAVWPWHALVDAQKFLLGLTKKEPLTIRTVQSPCNSFPNYVSYNRDGQISNTHYPMASLFMGREEITKTHSFIFIVQKLISQPYRACAVAFKTALAHCITHSWEQLAHSVGKFYMLYNLLTTQFNMPARTIKIFSVFQVWSLASDFKTSRCGLEIGSVSDIPEA